MLLFRRSMAVLLGCFMLSAGGCTSTDPAAGSDAVSSEGEGEGEGEGEPAFESLNSSLERETNPEVTDADKLIFEAGNNGFAFNIYGELAEADGGNIFLSPVSISVALAMTWAGAKENTAKQMSEVLGFNLPADAQHRAFNWLDQELNSRGRNAEAADGEPFRLNVVNAIWGLRGYGFLETFLDIIALNYGAGLQLLDFVGNAEAARKAINDWVEVQTEDRIKDLIPEGVLDAETRLVLTNAVYFNASWATQFEEENTRDGDFTTLSGSEVTVPMMNHQESYAYADLEGYQALSMPYDGHELEMVVLMPDAGAFPEFEEKLSADLLTEALEALEWSLLDLRFPVFEFGADYRLSEVLSAMGMEEAAAVIHKTFVKLNEKGTEAAAATAVVMKAESEPDSPPIEVNIDHPFIFLIRDKVTGAVVFLGRMADPS
jgi:serpin B